ncbi:hypothetical protein LR48_Vigan07g123400 [Vigna angularis]|uniref:Uncharacterized protein n=1 Tax=Phaseolus angularis TaxID=3914 RepID=A0A0L9UXG1_PHAAN|nr:hypothetical protein LR48_Vigan07g123400 [Vigna angularis]
MIAYVLTWLLLPGRLNEDRMSTEDVFLLNAIKTRIPTNCVAVLKHHMIAEGDDYACKLPYGVFIIKVLELQGVDVSEEEGIVCKRKKIALKSNERVQLNVWSDIAGRKAEGLDSHIRDSESNRWLTKRAIYINGLRYPRRHRVDKQYLHDGLNKEEKLIAYVLTWLLLPGRFFEDRMSIGDSGADTPRSRCISRRQTFVQQVTRNWYTESVSIRLERIVNGWFFRDELIVGSTPTPAVDHTAFIPKIDFEKYVVDQFRKKSERDKRVEDALFRFEKKGNKNGIGFETKAFDDESINED